MIYTIEEVQKMLKLWGSYREYQDRDEDYDRLFRCGSPSFVAIQHAKGHIRQDENCRAVFTPPPVPDYEILINNAMQALFDCPRLQYLVGTKVENGEIKIYTQARLLVSVLRRRYCYGMPIRRIGKHITRIKYGDNGKRVGNDTVVGLIVAGEQFICDYLNQSLKISDLVTKKLDETGQKVV